MRRENEKITIGADITITVVRLAAGQVRLGIDAPQELTIRRVTPDGRLEGRDREGRFEVETGGAA